MKNNDLRVVLIMAGHTAAGKSTFSKALCKSSGITYIGAGDIKRGFVENYSAKDSLNPLLLDKDYTGATIKAIEMLNEHECVLVDATFFKKDDVLLLNLKLERCLKIQ